MFIDLKETACFGVAGNFTGHLEQAGEDKDFARVTVKEANAPKALFPTYIPGTGSVIPSFLGTFPFDDRKIEFPHGEQKLQIEPECGIVFEAVWKDGFVAALNPVCFGASNDCSIRREGARKISEKKNWGKCSKGFSSDRIALSSFDEASVINDYRIASFMKRDGKLYEYGEDSAVRTYSYVYGKLVDWIIEKLNCQKNEGPAEDLHSYLASVPEVKHVFVSIGATRYTDFGEHNYLKGGDEAIVVLYPESRYNREEIKELLYSGRKCEDISILREIVID